MAEGMPCQYGCVPDSVLSDAEAYEIMRGVLAVGGPTVFSHEVE